MKDKINRDIQFLTAYEVSKFLDMPLSTLYDNTKNGKIKGIKIGKKWKYRKSDIDNYLFYGTNLRREMKAVVERRVYPRMNSHIKCNFAVNLPNKDENKGIVVNISAGGLLIYCINDQVLVEDPVNIEFVLEDKKIEAKGRVIRKNGKVVGVKFRKIDELYKNRIMEYIG